MTLQQLENYTRQREIDEVVEWAEDVSMRLEDFHEKACAPIAVHEPDEFTTGDDLVLQNRHQEADELLRDTETTLRAVIEWIERQR